MKLVYIGAFDEVVIAATGQIVKRNHSVDVDDEELASSLLEQEANWKPGKAAAAAKDEEK